MHAREVHEAGLFVALALVPGFASRNRHPELYEGAAGKRARMRARRIRAFLVAAIDGDEATATVSDKCLQLVVSRHSPRSSWTLLGDELDGAVCRYLLERGGFRGEGHKLLWAAIPESAAGLLEEALRGSAVSSILRP